MSDTASKTTTPDAWAKCPCPEACRRAGQEHPCLECWGDAGDIVAGLRLEELRDVG